MNISNLVFLEEGKQMLNKRIKFLGVLILVVSLVIMVGGCDTGGDNTPVLQEQKYTLTIEVKDGESNSLSNTNVLIEEENYVAEETDEEGTYIFEEIELKINEEYTIKASKNSYSSNSTTFITDKNVTNMTVEEVLVLDLIEDTYNISGKIIAEDDSPMEDVEVAFTEGYDSVLTDNEGYWEKKGLIGKIEVSAVYDGYSFSPGVIEVDDSKDNVNFVGSKLQEWQEEIGYTDKAKTLPESEAKNIEKVSENKNEITFKENTIFMEGLKEGDVLIVNQAVPGAEEGLLERITEISKDERTAKIEPAMLDDVIETGDISVTTSITFDYMVENMQAAEGVKILDVDKQSGKIYFERELTDSVTIEGYIGVVTDTEVGLELKYREKRWLPDSPSGIKEFEFYFIPGFETKINLNVGENVEWDNDYKIVEIPGPPIPIYGPVAITPRISLVVGAEGEVGAEMYTEATYDRYYRAGFCYHNDSGWNRILEEEGDDFHLEEPSLKGFASARVYVGPNLMGSAGVAYVAEAGMGVSVYNNIQAEGEVQPSPSWMWSYDLDMFVEAALFANLELLRIASIDWEGPSQKFLERNLAYGASGYVNMGGGGLEGVEIDFESDNFISSSKASKTGSDGYWNKHLLSDSVTVIPSKDGYYFEPESRIITSSASDVNFTAFPEDGPIEEYTLTIQTEGKGTTTPIEGPHTYNEDETVNISASPDEGWIFSYWEGDVADTESAETTVTMTEDKLINVVFEEEEEFPEGEGTYDDPYVVKTAEQLDLVRNFLNSHFIQNEDINLNEYISENGWLPIGNIDNPFRGSFNGNGYKITNLNKINEDIKEDIGLFGVLGPEAKIENVTMESAVISGENFIGGIAGYNAGEILNSKVGIDITADSWAGGIVGINAGLIVDSQVVSNVSGGSNRIGGFVGENQGEIYESKAISNVNGNNFIGGFSGVNFGLIEKSQGEEIKVEINLKENERAGGFVGENAGGKIKESYVQLSKVKGGILTGGFLGFNSSIEASIDNFSNRVDSLNSNPKERDIFNNTIHLMAENTDTGEITNCYAVGDVFGFEIVGGFVGGNNGSINLSYVAGGVFGEDRTGGFVGENIGDVKNSYWDISVGLAESDGGIGKSTDEMMNSETFKPTWDFKLIWEIIEGESYPFLQWQSE